MFVFLANCCIFVISLFEPHTPGRVALCPPHFDSRCTATDRLCSPLPSPLILSSQTESQQQIKCISPFKCLSYHNIEVILYTYYYHHDYLSPWLSKPRCRCHIALTGTLLSGSQRQKHAARTHTHTQAGRQTDSQTHTRSSRKLLGLHMN